MKAIVIIAFLTGLVLGAVVLWFIAKRRPGFPKRSESSVSGQHLECGAVFTQNDSEPFVTYLDPDSEMAIQSVPLADQHLNLPQGRDSASSSTPLGQDVCFRMIGTLPALSDLLKGGRVVRVIGPERLVRDLESGLVQRLGQTGAVANKSSGRIVGQLRLSDLKSLRKIVGPLAAYQFASALTCQYYLNRITEQLDKIERSVADIRDRLQSKTFGGLHSAEKTLDEIEELVPTELSQMDEQRFVVAQQKVDEAYCECLRNLGQFRDRMKAEFSGDRDKINMKQFRGMLEEFSGAYLNDLLLFGMAVKQTMRSRHMQMLLEARNNRDNLSIRRSQMLERIVEIRNDLDRVTSDMDTLLRRRLGETLGEVFKKLWSKKYKSVSDELKECQRIVRPIYEEMRGLLPKETFKAQVIEIRVDESGRLAGTRTDVG